MSNVNPEQRKINPDQLPSLDETAKVPMQHSDKVNSAQYWNDKLEGETAVVPPEHRDDRMNKSKISTSKKM